jgi:hypothetical protein
MRHGQPPIDEPKPQTAVGRHDADTGMSFRLPDHLAPEIHYLQDACALPVRVRTRQSPTTPLTSQMGDARDPRRTAKSHDLRILAQQHPPLGRCSRQEPRGPMIADHSSDAANFGKRSNNEVRSSRPSGRNRQPGSRRATCNRGKWTSCG